MAVQGTAITNIIVPDVFIPYTIQRTTDLSRLVQSGIVVPDPQLDILAQKGGKLIDMPFFNDLTGADEVLSDSDPLTVGRIGTSQDVARLLMRGKAWGVGDLAKALSGADPMAAIGDLVAEYWNRREQVILLSALAGVFADNVANDSSDLVHDISVTDAATATASNLIGPDAVIDAKAKLGDAADKLVAIQMHSVVYARLQKLNLIEMVPDSEGKIKIPTYLGLEVIVEDGAVDGTDYLRAATTNGYRYTSYLFGKGAVGRGEGNAPVPVETDRDSLQGEDFLIHRRHFILHPRGIRWTETACTGASPTNTELTTTSNWNRVYSRKNIRIVKLVTNG